MAEKLNFRISSGLKDIIGRDLITDDYVAVFELVKNAYDAYATQVDIYFENIYLKDSKIIIKDNGKGMNFEDIVKKWLFVAYSAKKAGTEDDTFDYRDKIYQNRPFAGAKGIGRFSCDRLGKLLYLETTKKEYNPKTEIININWELFEGNYKDEFINIDVKHDTDEKSNYGLKHGTVIKISGLRSDWDRTKLLRLKDSLAKLITPDNNKSSKEFKIIIHAQEEKVKDNEFNEYYKIVNGEIKNFIFDTLGLRTTKIYSYIDTDKKYINTELHDSNNLIYKIKENNRYNLLGNISFVIFYLNRSAKYSFTKKMGISSASYGHIFLYKNGFRIYPYGEPGEDPLKIDVRKAQGQKRFFGTRELIGQIEIFGINNELNESASRGDGLIRTKTYYQLQDCFWDVLKKLENYVIKIKKWGIGFEELDKIQDRKVKTKITQLIAKISGSENIVEFDYGDNFYQILEDSQSESALIVLNNLKSLALKSNNNSVLKEIEIAEDKFKELLELKSELEKDLVEKTSQNLFLTSLKSQDYKDLLNYMHQIADSSARINNYIRGITNRINNNIKIEIDEIQKVVNQISIETNKITSISRFATKANFQIKSKPVIENIATFCEEYLINVIKPYLLSSIELQIYNKVNKDILYKFKPLEFIIMIDNLISNSKKANATKIQVTLSLTNNGYFEISFKDNGIGIDKKNLNRILEYGYSTTDGSGMGLTHVKDIIDNLEGCILQIDSEIRKGTIINIKLKY